MSRIKKIRTPKLFQQPKTTLNDIKDTVRSSVLASIARDLSASGYNTKKTPKYITATEEKMRNNGIIDMKYKFARSSKRKESKGGGWYLVVPIQMKARNFPTTTIYKEALAQGKNLNAGESITRQVKGLAEGLASKQSDTFSSLSYKPKANNVTMSKNSTGKRTGYTAFRTVSNKSAPSSWIIGRGNMKSNGKNKTLERDVKRLMQWKLKNLR